MNLHELDIWNSGTLGNDVFICMRALMCCAWFVSMQGVKGDPAQPKEARFLSKAGWVKKASGRVLAMYKDRYVHVEKFEVVVYENEVGYGAGQFVSPEAR